MNLPELETKILDFWDKNKIYAKTVEKRKGQRPFSFFEGPPTANGKPHPGHCLTRAVKDVFLRYKTMQGFSCERKAGWDTHGLPVEVEVCKDLGIHSKEDIEAFGVKEFINKCVDNVFTYTKEWEELTRRIGYWVDLDNAYVTYHQSYVESVWWSLKTLFDQGLLYQDHKIVWWWAQGGTALSAGEVGDGYREVSDPSVYVRLPIVDSELDLLIWTTTPWTLPANQLVAVNPSEKYVVVKPKCDTCELGRKFLVAESRVGDLLAKEEKYEVHKPGLSNIPYSYTGRELAGVRYRCPLTNRQGKVVTDSTVDLSVGTGLVHIAPAFGESDFQLFKKKCPTEELVCDVDKYGRFTNDFPLCEGMWVKDADKKIIAELKNQRLLFRQETCLHEYPFCWRSPQDPLIQYPRTGWFINTTKFRNDMLLNNDAINWLPEHIKEGRFGEFLRNNVDWAVSRERYWGTPLPIWVCSVTGKSEAVCSYDELLSKPGVAGLEVWADAKKLNPELSDHLKVHKPYIDAVTYSSPFDADGRMQRVPDVIDCWYDSGAMPFAQFGGRKAKTADFICEAIDQTRGWFYSLIAINTMLFDRPSFKNCVVLGHMLGEDGNKMAKQKRNYLDPKEIFNKYGADTLRWYFFSKQPPWKSVKYNENAIKSSMPEFILKLLNVVEFYKIYSEIDYSEIDGFLPEESTAKPVGLDKWILNELQATVNAVTECMDRYDCYKAAQSLNDFVDALSNWYLRRSRSRFWTEGFDESKASAYATLFKCLKTLSKLIAPFVPFVAEYCWQEIGATEAESVHLTNYPATGHVDLDLSSKMNLVREIVGLGRNARVESKLKVRQPLSSVKVVLNSNLFKWLSDYKELICDELNVKDLEIVNDKTKYTVEDVQLNYKTLGPKFGKELPRIKELFKKCDKKALLSSKNLEGFKFSSEDLIATLKAREGFSTASNESFVVVLVKDLTEELKQEGFVRELVHQLQNVRKEKKFYYTDRIDLQLYTDSEFAQAAIKKFSPYLKNELLVENLVFLDKPGGKDQLKIDECEVEYRLYVHVDFRKHRQSEAENDTK